MSQNKKNQAKKRKYADPKTGEFRHSDGDRRHRRGATAKDAIKHKKQMQEMSSLPPEESETEFDDFEDEDGDNFERDENEPPRD